MVLATHVGTEETCEAFSPNVFQKLEIGLALSSYLTMYPKAHSFWIVL